MTSDQLFAPGEVAILLIDGMGGKAGDEVTVLRQDDIDHRLYWFAGAYGEWLIEPRHLRKKRPPPQLSTWQDVQKVCGWKPQQVPA